jgi:hypothetical protein
MTSARNRQGAEKGVKNIDTIHVPFYDGACQEHVAHVDL